MDETKSKQESKSTLPAYDKRTILCVDPFTGMTIDSEAFDEAVGTVLQPMMERLRVKLLKVEDGVYDMPVGEFVVRIRLSTGHRKGINIIIRPAAERTSWDDNKSRQLGLRHFVRHGGGDSDDFFITVGGLSDYRRQVGLLLDALEQYCLPWILAKPEVFDQVHEEVQRHLHHDLERIKSYNFPRNVREEWPVHPEDD